jgi:hypothetical protein
MAEFVVDGPYDIPFEWRPGALPEIELITHEIKTSHIQD